MFHDVSSPKPIIIMDRKIRTSNAGSSEEPITKRETDAGDRSSSETFLLDILAGSMVAESRF
jgi:hypothetical protein